MFPEILMIVSGISHIRVLTTVYKIENVILTHEKGLENPEAFVKITKYADSAIEYTARLWVKTEDYWTVYFEVLEKVKKAFDENNIVIPYPPMDVHVKSDDTK